jgi:SWI/SNF-related matrix-associated actin-dependent regulator of chromatin subfamily A-like protein 1
MITISRNTLYEDGKAVHSAHLAKSSGRDEKLRHFFEKYEASYCYETSFEPKSPEGLSYLPYQKAGIEYLINSGNKNVLLADEQGLGKTIQAIGYANHRRFKKILVICPAFLKINWLREFQTWYLHEINSQIMKGINDTIKDDTELLIVNYDILSKNRLTIKRWLRDALILIDEAQYLKNPDSKRTKACVSLLGNNKVIAISGTPINNRPIDFWSLWSSVFRSRVPQAYLGMLDYGIRYCSAFRQRLIQRGEEKEVWNMDGASNTPELNYILRERFMLRRLKEDVLTQLPDKRYNVIDLASDEPKIEKILKEEDSYSTDVLKSIDGTGRMPDLTSLAGIRRQIAELKVTQVIQFIQNVLDSEEQVFVIAHHKTVIEAIYEACIALGFSSAIINGSTGTNTRQKHVDNFQKGIIRVLIGNIQATGVGITLTASRVAVFAECSWVPSENEQVVDRIHRIGQTRMVDAYFLVFGGSLDSRILRRSFEKKKIIDKILK